MTPEHSYTWAKFLAGHWQKETPSAEGAFPTAARAGEYSGLQVVYRHPDTKEFMLVRGHGGWFWSEPLPELPKPPKWDE